MTEAIDSAFTDRADIKMLINLPQEMAIYTILKAAIEELIKVNNIFIYIFVLNYRFEYLIFFFLGKIDYKCRSKR